MGTAAPETIKNSLIYLFIQEIFYKILKKCELTRIPTNTSARGPLMRTATFEDFAGVSGFMGCEYGPGIAGRLVCPPTACWAGFGVAG